MPTCRPAAPCAKRNASPTTTTATQVPVGLGPFTGNTALAAGALLLGAGLAAACGVLFFYVSRGIVI